MYFKNEEHQKNFHELCLKVSKTRYSDYLAAAYILSLPELYKKASPYFSDDGFYLEKVLEQDFSSGFKILLSLAGQLFNGLNTEFNLNRAIGTLDDDNFQVMIQSLVIRRNPAKQNI
jgi:hypothetical protein